MQNLSILIVDDDNVVRTLIEKRLLKEKFTNLDVAKNGLNAAAMVQNKHYDVVLTDLMMSGGIGGIELLENVKKNSSTTEVVLITGYSSIDSAVEAMKKGAFDYLEKPINFDELFLRLDKIANLKKILKYAQDVEQAKEATESAASETIQRMEMYIAEFDQFIENMSTLLGNRSVDNDKRIKQALNLINKFQQEAKNQ